MGQAELVDLLASTLASDRGFDDTTDWDHQLAQAAVRRWRSYGRRHKTVGSYEDRVTDLARGLLQRVDPLTMDGRDWHRRTAGILGEVLRDHLP